jgi:hypothetical protein
VKSPIDILQLILLESGIRCGISTTRDWQTITRRVEHEGWSFLTITLTDFGKDFEKSLDQGHVADDQFTGFHRVSGGLPAFLRGFLQLVFDTDSLRLLDEPSIEAIRSVRQLTLMFGKVELPCSEKRVAAAFVKFVECEQEVRHADLDFEHHRDAFSRIGRLLWAPYLTSVDHQIYTEGVVPRHGPGATADKLSGNGKYLSMVWTERLNREFPIWENLIPSPSFSSELDSVTILEPRDEQAVKVTAVPKTLKTPRIIAIEPSYVQYVQQGVLEVMRAKGAEDDFFNSFVRFDSQLPNQELAKQGSITGNLATLDLSEASDRVSNQHVRELLRNHPHLQRAVDACRSRKADVPGQGVIRLAKFASMGSALCFPFEALVFMTVVFVGIENGLNRRLTAKDVKSFRGSVRAYGDDIIVPTRFVLPVVEALEAFGFRVNRKKSFWNGKFRESCGREFYDGRDVSIARVRTLLPQSRLDAVQLASTVSLRNQLFKKSYFSATEALDSHLEGIIPLPEVPVTTVDALDDYVRRVRRTPGVVRESVVLGRMTYEPCQAQKFCDSTHRPLVRGAVLVSRPPVSPLDGRGALMKWFLKRGELPFHDRDHLQRSGRPDSVRIKIRWAPMA